MKSNHTVVVMFKPQFESAITAKIKRHTIRPPRKRQIPTRAILSLRVWTGLPYRSKTREFHRAPFERSDQIDIHDQYVVITTRDGDRCHTETIQSIAGLQALAEADGFGSWPSMVNWFTATHGLPFTGELIHWKAF